MRRRTAHPASLFALPVLTLLCVPTGAQNRPASEPRNYLPELKAIANRLSEQFNVPVAVDPLLFVATRPTSPPPDLTVGAAFDALAKSVKGSAWRRVYRPKGSDGAPFSSMRLAALVRGLAALEESQLIIEDVAKQKSSLFVKNAATASALGNDLAKENLAQKPVYVLYAKELSAKMLQAQAAQLQQEHAELISYRCRGSRSRSTSRRWTQACW